MTDETTSTCFEWGYRLPDGTTQWAYAHGTDGTWTSADAEKGIPAIDIYDGQEYSAIRQALDAAGHLDAVVIKRKMTLKRGATVSVDPGRAKAAK